MQSNPTMTDQFITQAPAAAIRRAGRDPLSKLRSALVAGPSTLPGGLFRMFSLFRLRRLPRPLFATNISPRR
jgi:hypothetical protein